MIKNLRTLCLALAALLISLPFNARGEEPAPRSPNGMLVRPAAEDLRVEDMTDAELNQRLAEYEASKRDDRDGYIILNQLWFNHQAKRTTSAPEFQRVVKMREGLLKKHPEFNGLQDFRLSDKIRFESGAKVRATQQVNKAKQWKPSDLKALRIIGSEGRAVAVHQYKLVFYKLPANVKLGKSAKSDRLALRKDSEEIEPKQLQAKKEMTFKTKFDIQPNWPDNLGSDFLVCTNPVARYTPSSSEEREMITALGHTHGMPWTNRDGAIDQFCGVVSLDGDVVYKFPFTESVPKSVMAPLKMAADGSWAAVMVGSVVEGEDFPEVGRPKEVWIWRKASGLQKYSAKDNAPIVRELLQFFPKQ